MSTKVAPVTKKQANVVVAKKVTKPVETKKTFTCFVDCGKCLEFVEPKKFVVFLKQTIKVNNKAGNTKEVEVKVEGTKVVVSTSSAKLTKKYIKYLTKKFLKRNNLRDWLRIVSNKTDGFTLEFFAVDQDEEDVEDEN